MKTPPVSLIARVLVMALTLYAMAFSALHFWQFSSGGLLSDFRAFYCAGQLASAGIDPYRQEPLYTCEAAAPSPLLWHATGHVTDPAPLPPYALALFVPLAHLPLPVAALLWSAAVAAAWIAVLIALRALTRYSWSVLGSCVLFGAMMSLSLGQIAPIAIALLVLAALMLARGRHAWAGVLAALAMIEPHVALPACAAIVLAVSRARLPLLATGAGLLAVSLLFGVARNLEYVSAALPAHALSDVPDVGQFSLTVLGHASGLGDALAARLGSLAYAIVSIAGIAVGLVLARRRDGLAFLALVPMAFAVFGGPYVHWQQVVGALPAALLLLRAQSRPQPLLVAAIVGLAIPWMYVVGWGFMIPGATAVAGTIVWQLLEPPLLSEAVVVAGVFCAFLFLNRLIPHAPAPAAFVAAASPNDWADESWGAYVRARIPIGNGLFFWLHFPTWAALAATLVYAVREARPSTQFILSERSESKGSG